MPYKQINAQMNTEVNKKFAYPRTLEYRHKHTQTEGKGATRSKPITKQP